MEKRGFKIALGAFVLALTMLGSFKNAQASNLFFSSTNQAGFIYGTHDISSNLKWSADGSSFTNIAGAGTSYSREFGFSATANPLSNSSSTIDHFDFVIRNQTAGNYSIDFYYYFNSIATGTPTCSGHVLGKTILPGTNLYQFDVHTDACVLDSSSQLNFLFNGTADLNFELLANNVNVLSGYGTGDGYYDASLNEAYEPWLQIWTGPESNYQIAFHTGFSDNMFTPDFNVWQLDLTFPAGMYNPGWQVEYKNASSSQYTYFDKFFFSGYAAEAFTSTISNLVKHTDLTPGNYEAQAVLFSNYNPIVLSDVLHFTVVSGTKIDSPGNSPVPTTTWTSLHSTTTPIGLGINCGETNFQIFSVDYGQGLCNVGSYLFMPHQATLENYSNLWDGLKQKPPFGYFNIGLSAVSDLSSTTTTSTAPSVNLGLPLGLLSTFLTPIDTGLALLTGMAFLFFLWHRFRTIEF